MGTGFIDLHCHWVAAIDDGARTLEQGLAMLTRLQTRRLLEGRRDAAHAARHVRQRQAALERAYAAMIDAAPAERAARDRVSRASTASTTSSSTRLPSGAGLPYPGGNAVLVELNPQQFPIALPARASSICGAAASRRSSRTPSATSPTWKDTETLEPLIDAGACLLLDVCALVGKYGERPKRAAEKLLEEDDYEAACSDAHRAEDADETAKAIVRLRKLVGRRRNGSTDAARPRSHLRRANGAEGGVAACFSRRSRTRALTSS